MIQQICELIDEPVGGLTDALTWMLPGHGEPRIGCGETVYQAHRCKPLDKYEWHWKRGIRSCHRPACPVCYERWAAREASRASERLFRYGDMHGERVVHWMASPPPGDAIRSKQAYRRLRAEAYRELRKHGFDGGLLIYHNLRVPGRWNERTKCADGPHFHALGFGWHKGDYKPGGWIVKNLRVRKSVPGTILYQLSHCSLGYGVTEIDRDSSENEWYPASSQSNEHARLAVQTVTWFGTMSYSKFSMKLMPGMVDCPVCGELTLISSWTEVYWLGRGDPPPSKCGILTDDWYIAQRGRASEDIFTYSAQKDYIAHNI